MDFDHKEFSLMMQMHRRGYDASCRLMSELCGLGVNQWRMYEEDSSNIATAQRNLITMACTPSGMLQLLSDYPDSPKKAIMMRMAELAMIDINKELSNERTRKEHNYWRRYRRWYQYIAKEVSMK